MLTVDDIAMIKEALEPQFERVDERLSDIDTRLSGIDTRFEHIDARFDRVDRQLAVHEDNFRVIVRRLDKQDRDLKDFAATVVTSFAGLEDHLDAVADDVTVIKDIVKDHGFRLVRLEGRYGRRT